MPADPLWINASAGAPAYAANELRQAMALPMMYDGRQLGAREGVRPGGTQMQVSIAGSTITVQAGVALVDPGLTTTQGPYWVGLASEQHTLTPADATNPRKDIVILRVHDHDEDASGLRLARTEYVVGTPSPTPSEPTVSGAAGWFRLATIDVPQQGGGNPAVTNNAPFTAAAGGVLVVSDTAERDALDEYAGLVVWRKSSLNAGPTLEVFDGAAWDYVRGCNICTSSTRPPHREGRVIYETDTDRVRVSDGSVWRLLNPGKDTQQASVAAAETTSNSSFTDLNTPGPSVSLHLESGQKAMVVVEALAYIDAAGTNGAVFSFEVAGPGASDLAAADGNGCETGHVLEWTPGSKHTLFTATVTGTHVFTMKYRRINANTANFKERRITVRPEW